jgi:hypothetical protein
VLDQILGCLWVAYTVTRKLSVSLCVFVPLQQNYANLEHYSRGLYRVRRHFQQSGISSARPPQPEPLLFRRLDLRPATTGASVLLDERWSLPGGPRPCGPVCLSLFVVVVVHADWDAGVFREQRKNIITEQRLFTQ